MDVRYYITVCVGCDWCTTHKFSEEEILRGIWSELPEEAFDIINSNIKFHFNLDEFYLKEEDFYKIARIDWEEVEKGIYEVPDDCIPLTIYLGLDFDKVKTLIQGDKNYVCCSQ